MVELVDTTALEAVAARCGGSSPLLGTILNKLREDGENRVSRSDFCHFDYESAGRGRERPSPLLGTIKEIQSTKRRIQN